MLLYTSTLTNNALTVISAHVKTFKNNMETLKRIFAITKLYKRVSPDPLNTIVSTALKNCFSLEMITSFY